MDTANRTFDGFLTWIGWHNVQGDHVSTTNDQDHAEAEADPESDTSLHNVIDAFLNDDAAADFVFHRGTEDKRTCRYIAIHPNRLPVAEFIWAVMNVDK